MRKIHPPFLAKARKNISANPPFVLQRALKALHPTVTWESETPLFSPDPLVVSLFQSISFSRKLRPFSPHRAKYAVSWGSTMHFWHSASLLECRMENLKMWNWFGTFQIIQTHVQTRNHKATSGTTTTHLTDFTFCCDVATAETETSQSHRQRVPPPPPLLLPGRPRLPSWLLVTCSSYSTRPRQNHPWASLTSRLVTSADGGPSPFALPTQPPAVAAPSTLHEPSTLPRRQK